MGAWPHDEAQSAALISLRRHACRDRRRGQRHHQDHARGFRHPDAAGQRRRPAHDAHGDLPRARHPARRPAGVRAREGPDRREVRPIVDKVLEMGDGDAAVGTVRAFEAGVMDIPWSPNRHVQEPRAAGARRRRLPAHPRPGPDAVPAGRPRGARGAAAQARRARWRAVRQRARRRERLRDLRAARRSSCPTSGRGGRREAIVEYHGIAHERDAEPAPQLRQIDGDRNPLSSARKVRRAPALPL